MAGGSPGSNKEKKEEEGEGGGERSSQFKSFLEEWTWGQVRQVGGAIASYPGPSNPAKLPGYEASGATSVGLVWKL